VRTGTGEVHETPVKKQYSHPQEARKYMLLGGGEHNVVLQRSRRRGPPGSVWDDVAGEMVDPKTGKPPRSRAVIADGVEQWRCVSW
jgi:hypothetical protein